VGLAVGCQGKTDDTGIKKTCGWQGTGCGAYMSSRSQPIPLDSRMWRSSASFRGSCRDGGGPRSRTADRLWTRRSHMLQYDAWRSSEPGGHQHACCTAAYRPWHRYYLKQMQVRGRRRPTAGIGQRVVSYVLRVANLGDHVAACPVEMHTSRDAVAVSTSHCDIDSGLARYHQDRRSIFKAVVKAGCCSQQLRSELTQAASQCRRGPPVSASATTRGF
jgi:hypothetical protein